MARSEDVLELLLPKADSRVVHTARNVTHFLRLLSDDARPQRAASVCVDLDRARHEFDRQDRRVVEGALCDLLRHHLTAIVPEDSFAWSGEPVRALHDAWCVLAEYRDELEWLAGVPEPDEPALAVAERLCDSLARLGSSAAELALWRARIARSASGVRAAEKAFRQALGSLAPTEKHGPIDRALVAGAAECMLDRAAVREAHAWLIEHRASTALDPRLRQLLCWCRLCLGDLNGAKALSIGLRPWMGPLPASLAELRKERPAWLSCLSGKVASLHDEDLGPGARRVLSRIDASAGPRERSDVGAAVFAVFVFRPGLSSHAVVCDVAAGLRDRVAPWLREREGVCTLPTEREHSMVVLARNVTAHRDGEPALTGVLGRDTTCAVALAPVLDEDGEVAGWLHIEWEHHLVPCERRLRAWAQAWRAELRGHAHVSAPVLATSGSRSKIDRAAEAEALARARPLPDDDPRAHIFRGLVQELGMKTLQRRWHGFEVDPASGDLSLVVEGGEGLGLAGVSSGERRALHRALATSGCVVFEDPDPRLSIDASASSGLVLSLCAGGRVCGLLAVESSRRRDFRGADIQRFAAEARKSGLALRASQFRVWHREHYGFDVWLDPMRADFREFADRILTAGRSRAAVVLHGPAGAGKLVLARWLHFESALRDGPLAVFRCRAEGTAPMTARGFSELARSAAGGSLLFDDVEHLDPRTQEELARWLEEGCGAPSPATVQAEFEDQAPPPRVFATTRIGLAAAVQSGAMARDLAHRLDRLELRVPPLRERREDILHLVRCLGARFAADEGLRPLNLTDHALALLWRQRWDGNVRELENFVYKLVVFSRGELFDADQVSRIARQFQVGLERKLPSRHPERSDLIAALRVTRKIGGKMNKTRAALYLGWDPDTLVARITEARITDENLDEMPPPVGGGPEAPSTEPEPAHE